MAHQSKYAKHALAGGAERINFLNKCIMEGMTDYVFEFLVSEYRTAPSKKKAIAIYDLFCSQNAPYRINCDELLPPKNPQLSGMIDWYREQRQAAQQMNFAMRIAVDEASKGVKRPTSGAQKSFVNSWIQARRQLLDAGFSSMQGTWGP
jgi:hypothetical protein